MDWSSLPSDLVAGLLGTLVGRVAGLEIDRRRERRRSKSRDVRLIQNLVDALASKRAFSHASDVGLIDDPEDRKRCNESVLDVRERIWHVLDQVTDLNRAVPMLRQMELDCVSYLNHVERQPTYYAAALIRLRDRLHESAQELGRVVPALDVTEPGSRTTLSTADWLV